MWLWSLAAALVAGCWLGVLWPLLLMLLLAVAVRVHRYRLLLLAVGYGIGALQLQWALDARLPPSLEGQTLVFQAQVVDLPRTVRERRFGQWRWRQTVLLAVKGNPQWPGQHRLQVNAYAPDSLLKAGQQGRVAVKLRAGRGQYNATGTDLARRDLGAGIHGRGTLQSWQPEPDNRRWTERSLLRWRAALAANVAEQVSASPLGRAVLPALVVGDRSAMGVELWQHFQATGGAHLLAISGLHIAIVAGAMWWLGRWLLMPLCQWLCPGLRRFPLQQLAWLPSLLAALGYCALAGFSLPTLRAATMLCVLALARCWRQPLSLWQGLGLALLVVLLIFPLSALTASLWLSFGAVATIAWLSPLYQGRWLVVLLPAVMTLLGALLFQQWSLSAPLANLVLIPLYSLLVIPLALLGTLLMEPVILYGAATAIEGSAWLMEGLTQLTVLPMALLPLPDVISGAMVLAGVIFMLGPAIPFPRRLLPLFLLPWLSRGPAPLAEGEWELIAFDVGQGLAVVVRTREHALLYDTGPSWPSGSMALSIIRPWFQQQGIQPDRVVISHGDNDHAGGVRDLLPPPSLLSGEPGRVPGSEPCRAGQQWLWDSVRFRVLWPRLAAAQGNDASCVLHVQGPYFSVLLPGDISKSVEYQLLGALPPVDLLVLPHHGSDSSTSSALLRNIQPSHALASAGYRNHFGHPHHRVLARLRSAGVTVLRTDRDGMIVFRRGDADNVPLITKWRQRYLRPWHQQPGWRFW